MFMLQSSRGFLFRGDKLVNCPDCEADVATMIKEWDVSPNLHVKVYDYGVMDLSLDISRNVS